MHVNQIQLPLALLFQVPQRIYPHKSNIIGPLNPQGIVSRTPPLWITNPWMLKSLTQKGFYYTLHSKQLEILCFMDKFSTTNALSCSCLLCRKRNNYRCVGINSQWFTIANCALFFPLTLQFSNISLIAWNWPWWEYLFNGNWQTLQIRVCFLSLLESHLLNIYQYSLETTGESAV